MQKNRWILAGLTGSALIIGCHSFYPSQAAYQQKLNGWIGKSAEELYDTWGFPPQTTPLGENKIMVTYFYSADAPIDDDYEPYTGQLSYNAMAVPTFGLSPAEPPLYYCQTSFILHNDVVVDFNFSGDDCK